MPYGLRYGNNDISLYGFNLNQTWSCSQKIGHTQV